MQIIIYGRDNCPNCARSKMLCQIKSLDFDYHTVGRDISTAELVNRIGHAVTSLPQIFVNENGTVRYVGGYEDLRAVM